MAVKAIADIYKIQISDAAVFLRNNPLFGNEIHIDEELINLEEMIRTYWQSDLAFKKKYPALHRHLATERYESLKHTIGLIVRMIGGKPLPFEYSKSDCDYALRRLARLTVFELQATGIKVDKRLLQKFQPFLSVRQRWQTGDNILPGTYGRIVGRVRIAPSINLAV